MGGRSELTITHLLLFNRCRMTSVDRLRVWVAQGESEVQELKETTGQRRAAGETLCAFLNHRGGRVIFGVDARGRVRGQQVTDRTVEDVGQEVRLIEPPVFPTIERIPVDDDREVLVVTVDQGSRRPYAFRGVAYRRIGATNAPLSRDEYNRLLLEQFHGVTRWENEPAAGWAVGDSGCGRRISMFLMSRAPGTRLLLECSTGGVSSRPGAEAPSRWSS